MSSIKMVTRYPVLSKRNLEWEIQNVSLLINKCDECWAGKSHNYCIPSTCLTSEVLQVPVDGGKTEKWYFFLSELPGGFEVSLTFEGLFGSDGSLMTDVLEFRYVVNMKKSRGESSSDKFETFSMFNGNKPSLSKENRKIKLRHIPTAELKSIWPHGNIAISVELFQVSKILHEVSNTEDSDGLILEPVEIELKDSLAGCYGNLLNNSDLSDFKIICKDYTFRAHKFILMARSQVFRKMLKSGLSESVNNKLKIEDMTKKTLTLMLEYIYKGAVEHFPEDVKEKIELLDSAEKYELEGLKSICMRKLFSDSNLPVTVEKNIGDLAMAASLYGAHEGAVKAIKDLCTKNYATLIKNPEYKKMFLANPQIFMD